ncbi:MAG TPA: FecR domain-containing protein [Hyphomicrobiales bacterium]|nr:FecR domain-containing protein [Hyphomicrobiales bacterium]
MSSNVIRLRLDAKRQQAMRDEASLWIVRISAGTSEDDFQKVHAWLDEHPDHVRALMDAARMWDEVSVLSELSDVFPLQEYLKPHPVRASRVMYSVFATFLLVVGLCVPVLVWLQGVGGDAASDALQLSYETRVGQQSTVVLPDGSVVVLNTNTKIDISFSPKYRDIVLHQGEGHFTVAKNKSRPFRVHTNNGIVEAVGTAFTVQQLEQKVLEVTVLEGEVNVMRTMPPEPVVATPSTSSPEPEQSPPAQPSTADVVAAIASTMTAPIPLMAGESLQINENDGNVVKANVAAAELETRLAWRDGMLLFHGDSLETAIREVSRYTDIQIDVDEKVRNISVLGNFRTGDIEGMLLSLSITFNLQVERPSEDHIVLKAAN